MDSIPLLHCTARGPGLPAPQDIAAGTPCRIFPFLARRFLAQRSDPGNVFDPSLGKYLTAQKSWTGKDAVTAAEMYQIADEPSQFLVRRPDVLPVEPGNLVVLTIGIVVAALCPPDLIACQQHRHAERQKKGGQQVALLAVAQGDDLRISGRPLPTVIAAIVGISPVAVGLAISLVVLLAVANKIRQ